VSEIELSFELWHLLRWILIALGVSAVFMTALVTSQPPTASRWPEYVLLALWVGTVVFLTPFAVRGLWF
jgi:hypothetical protein